MAVLATLVAAQLVPVSAHANGLRGLAQFAAYLVCVLAPAFVLMLAVTIVCAIIGRQSSPTSRNRRIVAWVCTGLSILTGVCIFVMPLFFGMHVLEALMWGVMFCPILVLAPLLLGLRAARRQREARRMASEEPGPSDSKSPNGSPSDNTLTKDPGDAGAGQARPGRRMRVLGATVAIPTVILVIVLLFIAFRSGPTVQPVIKTDSSPATHDGRLDQQLYEGARSDGKVNGASTNDNARIH